MALNGLWFARRLWMKDMSVNSTNLQAPILWLDTLYSHSRRDNRDSKQKIGATYLVWEMKSNASFSR